MVLTALALVAALQPASVLLALSALLFAPSAAPGGRRSAAC
jgi:hypothetical protein